MHLFLILVLPNTDEVPDLASFHSSEPHLRDVNSDIPACQAGLYKSELCLFHLLDSPGKSLSSTHLFFRTNHGSLKLI